MQTGVSASYTAGEARRGRKPHPIVLANSCWTHLSLLWLTHTPLHTSQNTQAPSILSGKTPAAGPPATGAATTSGGTAAPTRAGSSAGGAPLQAWSSSTAAAAAAVAAAAAAGSPAGSRPYTPAAATDSQSTLGGPPLLPEATGGTSIGPSRMSTADRSSNNGAAAATASGLSASLASGSTTAAPSGAASAAVSFLRRPGGGGGGEPRPPVAVGAGVVAVEALRMAASFLSPSLALNAQIGKKNWCVGGGARVSGVGGVEGVATGAGLQSASGGAVLAVPRDALAGIAGLCRDIRAAC